MKALSLLFRIDYFLLLSGLALFNSAAHAQMMMRPPPFSAGIPGMAQFDAMRVARHQARTLLYRNALEELERNPEVANLPDCHPTPDKFGAPCIPLAKLEANPDKANGNRIALLIGNNDYQTPIPGLETPIKDISVIAELLETEFGYKTTILKNARKAEIASAFNRLATTTAVDDSVLVIYAGHGYLKEETDTGYWIPVDASVVSAQNWIANADIIRFLEAIPARQSILISDSCFSGTLARETQISKRSLRSKQDMLKNKTSIVFSSGGEEPVSDEGKGGHSIFAWGLIQSLKKESALTVGFDLYQRVKGIVMESYTQEPRYGELKKAGHFGGNDYFFERLEN